MLFQLSYAPAFCHRDLFARMLTEEATIERTRQDFLEARHHGVSGFPTVLFRDAEDLGIVTRGFVLWATPRCR